MYYLKHLVFLAKSLTKFRPLFVRMSTEHEPGRVTSPKQVKHIDNT